MPEEYRKLINIFLLPGPGNPIAGFHLAHCCPGFETLVERGLNDGKPLEYARDYSVTGCFIRTVPGRGYDRGAESLNLPILLELEINSGITRLKGDKIGIKTGDPSKQITMS